MFEWFKLFKLGKAVFPAVVVSGNGHGGVSMSEGD